MVIQGILVFIVGLALWLLGREHGAVIRVQYVESAWAGHAMSQARLQAIRVRALCLTIFGTVAVMVGYHFQWWTFLAALLVASVAAVVIGLLWLFVRLASYPHRSKGHTHTITLPDGTEISFAVHIAWQLPRSLTKYDEPTIDREVQLRIAEWFVSLTLDPPRTMDDALALIKSVSTKLAAFLIPAVLPHGSYLNITVTHITPPSPQEKYPGIIIGVSE